MRALSRGQVCLSRGDVAVGRTRTVPPSAMPYTSRHFGLSGAMTRTGMAAAALR
jgi:hypothetical protein